MNRVTKRTWLMCIFIAVLLGGMVVFLFDYALNASKWVAFSGSPHVYNSTNIGCGTITDRTGKVLLDITENREYASDEQTRKSTLHWLGDRNGYIKASAVSNYAAEMAGFDLINGIYASSGTGGTAALTISAKVQNTALKAMAGRKGTVAVYNYQTGEILCAVTSPTYDPENVPDIANDHTGTFDGVYLNRFIQSAYVPGSIFKIVTLATALQCVPDITERTFTCYGKVEYGTEAVTCQKAHGKQSLKNAFANSCNCAFAQISELIGKQNMTQYVQKYGIAESLSFDGITTAKGNYDVRDTAAVSFAWSCIGQYTDLVNPAQYMAFMGVIGGGGSAAKPYLMESVQNGDTITYQAETEWTDQILDPEVTDILTEYMRNNVKTIYGAEHFPELRVCAKTGTSELGGEQKPNAMFAGFVDSEEYPLAFIAVVENGGTGASTCVPIMGKVLAACKEVMDAQ